MENILEKAERLGITPDTPIIYLTVRQLAYLLDGNCIDQEQNTELLYRSVLDCGFSIRLTNCLRNNGIMTVGDITEHPLRYYWRMRNFGRRSNKELCDFMAKNGLAFVERL